MIEILLKCETADEAQMYLEAPKVRGAADDFRTGSETRLNMETIRKKNTPC
jgi:hypothetical protein